MLAELNEPQLDLREPEQTQLSANESKWAQKRSNEPK